EVFRVSVSGIVDSDSNPIFEALNLDNAFVDTTISDETDPGPEDTVTVTMTGPANVVEGDTTTDYTVTLSDPAPVGSIVTLAYSYTTASGDDITETTQAVIGADGVTATFTIDTVDDVYAEGDEVFRVSVSGIVDSDSNPIFEALNLDNAFVDTTISDETDPGPEDTVTVTMTGPANVVEGDTTTEYTVTLSDPAPVGSIVTLAYSYTTASGDDITETTQAVIGADGVTATFTIDTVDDVYAEGDEVFRVSVSGIVDSDSNPIFEALNLDNAFVDTTISDETDPGPEDTVTVTMTGPANVVEGDTTTDYTVTLSDPAPVGSIVTLAYSYTTASGDDITETTQAIIGADGVTATFTIDTVDDVYAEGDEVFRVSVSGIVDGDSNPIFEALDVSNAFVDTTISDETDPGPEDTVTVTMTGPANVVEGDTTTDYTVTLSDPAPVGSIVTLAYSYTTASGDDITETTQAIIGADGVTATFTIDTVDDVYAEGDEVFRVSVSGIVDGDSNPIFEALDVSNAFVDTTISDETDPGPEDTVTVTMTGPANVVEGDITTEYTVTLSDPAPVGSIVTLAYSYTTASGDDITETTQAIIGVDGVTATFTIDTVDDVYAEGDEVFRVSVSGIVDGDSNPIFEALNLDNAFVDTTISDETDPGPEDTVTVTMTGPANVVEGDITTEYTVTLSDPAPVGSIVTLAYSYTTASGDDITETTQAIIGVDGVTATFTIDTVDDVYAEGEGDEVFRVSVSGIVDGDSNPIFEALNLDNAFVDTTISDETDPGPEDTVTVTMTGPASVVEGDTTTEYTVTLSDPAPVGSIVTLAYSYTTASGDDITETTQAIIGVDGVTATFTIDTVDDVYAEGDEVFRVSVSGIVDGDSNPIFEVLNLDNAFVDTTISDETDPGPEDTVTVTMTGPASVVEGDTTTEYTVTLSDPAPVGSIVTLAYSCTTASGDDITETTQAIIGADGVTATFTIDTVDDVYAEGDEVFRVSVSGIVDSDSNPIFEALNLDNAFVDTTISDETDPGPEDTVTVTMTGPASVVEGDTTTEYTVTLSDPAPVGSIVTLAYSYTTASGDDITETTQAIIGADGVTATFTIDTVDDVYAEGDEVFRVSVSGIVDSDSNPIFEALNLDNAFVDTTISDETDPGPEDTVTVTMTGPANVVEGDITTEYTVTLSDPAPVGSIVTLAYSYTTASGDDITETTQAVIGADGVTATFTIDTVDDSDDEPDEVYRVSVASIVDGDDNPIFEALDLTNAYVDTTIIDNDEPNTPPTVRNFNILLDVEDGLFPIHDVDFDGTTSGGEQRVEDLEDDAVTANDDDIQIKVIDLPDYGELYYVDGNGQEVVIDGSSIFAENTDVKYRLTADFFEDQRFDSNDLLEEFDKDFLADSVDVNGLSFYGGQITISGNDITFDSNAQVKVDFANQQVGLVVVSPGETGNGDEISTHEYVAIKLDEGLEADKAKINLASLNDRFNNGGAWITAYIFLDGIVVDTQEIRAEDISYSGNHEGTATIELANGSFDEIRLSPDTDSSSDKASFTLVGTEITSFTQVSDSFEYKAIDSDGLESDSSATVAVDFENVTVDAVTALGYQTMALNSELNLIMGTDGDDILVGTDGNDMIIGGLGNDILTGGEGDDVFKWTEMQSATDTVTDFSDGDQLDFTDVFDDMTGTDISALLDDLGSGDYRGRVDDITVEVTESGGNSTLTINKDGQQLEVNFDGASAADIANSLISNLEQLRE
ncbi:Calx-beta domain-containing protein, partial [Vibrio parahaemolyticus]